MNEKPLTIDERLKSHPELRERIMALIDITEGTGTGPDTADAAEERAIIEVQKMGQEIMKGWAEQKAKKEVAQFQEKHSESRLHKKK